MVIWFYVGRYVCFFLNDFLVDYGMLIRMKNKIDLDYYCEDKLKWVFKVM